MPEDPHRSLWRHHRTHGPSCAQFLGKYEWAPPARILNKVAAIFAQLCSLSLSGPNTVNDPERHSFRWEQTPKNENPRQPKPRRDPVL